MNKFILNLMTNLALNTQLSFLVPEEYDLFFSGKLEMYENDICAMEIEKWDYFLSIIQSLSSGIEETSLSQN